MTESSTARIRELNDAFRKTFAGGKMVMTANVAALPEMVKASALLKLAEFNDFTPEIDPHGEHDICSSIFQLVSPLLVFMVLAEIVHAGFQKRPIPRQSITTRKITNNVVIAKRPVAMIMNGPTLIVRCSSPAFGLLRFLLGLRFDLIGSISRSPKRGSRRGRIRSLPNKFWAKLVPHPDR